VYHNQDVGAMAHSNRDLPLLIHGMSRVINRDRIQITKHRRRFFESDAVFPRVNEGFVGIPFEIQAHLTLLPPTVRIPTG
jgi:hypothetical protein